MVAMCVCGGGTQYGEDRLSDAGRGGGGGGVPIHLMLSQGSPRVFSALKLVGISFMAVLYCKEISLCFKPKVTNCKSDSHSWVN